MFPVPDMPLPALVPTPALAAPRPARGAFRLGGRRPRLCDLNVISDRVPAPLDGFRIGHLSDIHVRTGVRHRMLERAVEMMNELAPDIVVLTGDYVCATARPVKQLTRALRELQRPAYAVLGNHDHWSDAAKIRAALADAGVDVLTNAHRILAHAGHVLHLVGIDDSVTRHDDPEAAFRGVPADATSVVLSHDPRSADWIHRFRPALILSGHTHGGQFVVPPITNVISGRLGMKYLSGFFGVEGAVLYVNRGLGASIPLRFRAPVEVAQLTLRSHAVAQRAGEDGSSFAA